MWKRRQRGKGKWREGWREPTDVPLSRQETSLTRSEKFICAGEKKQNEPGGSACGLRKFKACSTKQPGSRHSTTKPECLMYCEVDQAGKHKPEVGPARAMLVWPLTKKGVKTKAGLASRQKLTMLIGNERGDTHNLRLRIRLTESFLEHSPLQQTHCMRGCRVSLNTLN